MTDPNRMKDWELQAAEPDNDQWQLLDAEQELPEELRLSNEPTVAPEWQPLGPEERRDRSGGRNWLLSILIIFAMLAVVGYIGWLGFGGIGFPTITATEPTAIPTDVPAVAAADTPEPVQEVAPTLPPEPTATPTLEPTPTATPFLIDQKEATINSEYGLNVRAAPNADAEVITIVDNGATFQVTEEADGYAQIVLDDGRVGWVSSEFIVLAIVKVEPPPGFTPTVPSVPSDEATPAAAPGAPEITATAVLTTGIVPSGQFSPVIPDGPAVIVQAVDGVNARAQPDIASEVIIIVPQGAALPATAVSADGQWYGVTLPSGESAWMFAEAVESVNLDGLTAPAPTPAPPATSGGDAILAPTPVAGTAPSDAIPDDIVPTLIVDNLIGFGARSAPRTDADTVEFITGGTEWPALGRNEAGDWVQIELADGQPAWVHIGTAKLNVDVAALPVAQP